MKTEKVIYGSVYTIREAANNQGSTDCKRLWAEVQSFANSGALKEEKNIEVFTDPQDFGKEAMSLIVTHMDDELIDKHYFDKMKITIMVEYEMPIKEKKNKNS